MSSLATACLTPSHVKNGTRKSIATIGTLSGADEMIHNWCQSWTFIAQMAVMTRSAPSMVHLLMNLRIIHMTGVFILYIL